jgi:Holliday junction DNA helicase RuvA
MIAQLTGTVARVEANSVVLDVNGVGYRVMVPLTALSFLSEEGKRYTLHTIMVVREDDISLYGFREIEEQHIFTILTGVTGVGPKVALSMLSVMDWRELSRTISSNDVKGLTRVPGIGAKLAQRVCLELGDRLAEFMQLHREEILAGGLPSADNAQYEDIIEALVNLGYTRMDARKAAERVVHAAKPDENTGQLIREALNLLSGGKKG